MNTIIDEITNKDDKRHMHERKKLQPHRSVLRSIIPVWTHLRFCCSQARWDDEDKLKQMLPALMTLFHDEKPTVVRQCLNAAKELIA